MGKIKQLPVEVANQISAGEVIERPASVVKELVENSVDAGSDRILIEVDNGGKESIRVQDNGSGIGEDDLELAFSRYATSKIEGINDLYSLRTLGFRGEALASIASVSRLEVRTRTAEQLRGNALLIEGGKIIKREAAAVSEGTDIIVQDLFFNTPARFKYLKTVSTEYGHISNIVEREALARPEIKFTLKHNGKTVLTTPGSGKLLDAVYAIFGTELAESLIRVDFQDRYIKVDGYLANPNFHRSSRLYEYFFVNHRVVYNPVLSRGLEEGYRGLLPAGARPIAFLKLKLNQILVDINVHPTKKEVKFSRDEIIQDVLRKGTARALRENDAAPRPGLKRKGKQTKPARGTYSIQELAEKNNKSKHNSSNISYNNLDLDKEGKVISPEAAAGRNPEKKQGKRESAGRREGGTAAGKEDRGKKQENGKQQHITERKDPEKCRVKRLLGQISGTYILAEGEDGLYIIDQHNAHERVRYERLKEEYNKGRVLSQSLLIPVNLETNLQEAETIRYHLEGLRKMGFQLEEFGGHSFLVQEVPVQLKDGPIKNTLRDIIDKLMMTGRTGDFAELSEELISLVSCRGAIKAGKQLTREEMEGLLGDLFQTENIYRCPHGRPILLKFTEEEIAREMGRSAG